MVLSSMGKSWKKFPVIFYEQWKIEFHTQAWTTGPMCSCGVLVMPLSWVLLEIQILWMELIR